MPGTKGHSGRTGKTAEQHKIDGTYEHSRHDIPEVIYISPTMPEGMDSIAVDLWNELAPKLDRLGVFTETDNLNLQMLCEAYVNYRKADAIVKLDGECLTQVNGNIIEHPMGKARSRYLKEVLDISRQFGMTPISRTGISHVKKKPEESKLDLMLLGKRN